MPLHLSFLGIQRLFLQENSPALHFTPENKRTRCVISSWNDSGAPRCCSCERTTVLLVSVVAAVVEAVALPELWFTAAVLTFGLRRLALCRHANTNVCSGMVRSQGPVRSERSDSRHLSSSLPSPQSSQPSHCSVLLRQRLLVHWNLPGQADQSHQTDAEFHEPTGLEGFQRLKSRWMKRFRSVLRLVGTKVSYSAVKPWST